MRNRIIFCLVFLLTVQYVFGTNNSAVLESITLLRNDLLEITLTDGSVKKVQISPPLKSSEKREIKFKMPNGKFIFFDVIGENDNIPNILISEFCTKGNTTNKDAIEIYALSSGSLEGITLKYKNGSYTFGDEYIENGTYLAVTIDEGISSNNGEILLCSTPSPFSRVLDKVVYSNKNTSENSKDWRGIALDSRASSATKTFNRKFNDTTPIDTNTKNDWYVSKVKGRTFGKENTPYIE